ncbi:MAG: hypothetical protein ABIH82_05590 [Candidatus Woesearchaeota archaeon]
MLKHIIIILTLLFLVVGCGSKPEMLETDNGQDAVLSNDFVEDLEDSEVSIPTFSTTEVTVLGKNGFDPAELTVNEGDTVVFINKDPAEKDFSITFQRLGTRIFTNSDITGYGNSWENTFEAGTYYFWTLGYGVKGKLIVE